MIEILQKRNVIRDVLNSHRRNTPDPNFRFYDGSTAGEVRARLEQLDLSTCAAADVDAVFGNDSWTSLRCSECEADSQMLVRIGQEPDYDASWVDLCLPCLTKAFDLLRSTEALP